MANTPWRTRPPARSCYRLARVHDHWPTMPRHTGSNMTRFNANRTTHSRRWMTHQSQRNKLPLGLPDSIVSDNDSQFTAQEFQDFCKSNRIQHTRVAPYHPSSNGLAERAVKVFIRRVLLVLFRTGLQSCCSSIE